MGFFSSRKNYRAYKKREPSKAIIIPFVFISIGWAVSIHTVTAFLYSGLGARPFWNSAVLAPRFLASAFAAPVFSAVDHAPGQLGALGLRQDR